MVKLVKMCFYFDRAICDVPSLKTGFNSHHENFKCCWHRICLFQRILQEQKNKGDLCTFLCLMEAKLVIRKGHREGHCSLPISHIHYYCFDETKNEKRGRGQAPKASPPRPCLCLYKLHPYFIIYYGADY